jgi:hypothetical protein
LRELGRLFFNFRRLARLEKPRHIRRITLGAIEPMLGQQDLPYSTKQPRQQPDEVDYAQRDFINLVATIFLLVLALCISWTVRAVTEQERQLRCVESGRRDCVQIVTPPQGMRALR